MADKIILKINCTEKNDNYFEYNQTQIINTDFCIYREASSKPLSRFGYRFPVENPEKLHKLTVYYPDDKCRYMCIMNGTTYDSTTGIFTGVTNKITNTIKIAVLYFYPRFYDNSLVFMSWGDKEPAAISSFIVEEVIEIPEVEITNKNRSFGIQYEDPCNVASSEGTFSRSEWAKHVAAHVKMCGMNQFTYPIVWYHGPFYPSNIEKTHYFETLCTQDRNQYIRYTGKPYDWVAELIEELDKVGANFQGSLTLLRLSSLMEKLDDETILNALYNDYYQKGTNDWTPVYNIDNYPKILEMAKDTGIEPGEFKEFADKETRSPNYSAGPIFNPLHPTVQKAILNLVEEIVDKYSKYPNFTGISFNMWHSAFLWFSSIHSGYDDYSISLFEKETGIKVPVDIDDENRFSQRYDYLTYKCKNAWINWRCEKIFELFIKIRDLVKSKRSDMYITITNWLEMVIPSLVGGISPGTQLYARKSNVEIFKEAGLDINLFKNIDGIELDLQLEPARDRGTTPIHTHTLEEGCMFRDFDFLDNQTINSYKDLDNTGIFIFNSWVEAWGKHVWYNIDKDDPNKEEAYQINGKKCEAFAINSIYSEDGFWWESQARITSPYASGSNYMEYFAHAVAEYDAKKITSGGLYIDGAHVKEMQEFARDFVQIPKKPFTTIGNDDPVVVRFLEDTDFNYFYLVNREDYKLEITIEFNKEKFEVYNSKNQTEDWNKISNLELDAFQLKFFKIPKEINIVDFKVLINKDIEESYSELADKVITKIYNSNIPGAKEVKELIVTSLKEKRYAKLRHLLNSYIAQKVLE